MVPRATTSAPEPDWAPLAERMRPRTIDEFVGQRHLLAPGRVLGTLVEQRSRVSFVLWGPAGCGKTTLARLYAEAIGAIFHPISAVQDGVKALREVVEGARVRSTLEQRATVLFVDEIHRFSRTQQDALLPHVESGVITLVGATTENPSFSLTNALRSRCRVFQLETLGRDDLAALVERALADVERGLGPTAPELDPDALEVLLRGADGDARDALNTLEVAADLAQVAADEGARGTITVSVVEEARQKKAVLYDRNGDLHYQLVSAFIKAMRGSDPDAALYYMVRMLEADEDPLFLCRRMVIFASEDIGHADPTALSVALAATQAVQLIGMPEAVLPMTQAATWLACAPKSNSVFLAYGRARKDVVAHPNLPVPKHLVNAATALMTQQGFGRGYRYPHNYDGHYVVERYLPERLLERRYFEPSEQGAEKALADRLKTWRAQAGSR
jgi:putative ATPase